MNVAKIHRKLIITESQFYFANISATEAQIFMKLTTTKVGPSGHCLPGIQGRKL